MHFVQIISLVASAALIGNGTLPQAGFDVGKQFNPLVKLYYGSQIEAPSTTYAALVWESSRGPDGKSATEAGANNNIIPSLLKTFEEGSKHAQTKPTITINSFASFNAPSTPLNAPVTEFSVLLLKPGKTLRELDSAIAELVEVLRRFPGGYFPPAYGEVVGSPGTYYILLGWDSVEAHIVAASHPDALPATLKLLEVVNPGSVAHVAFQRVKLI